MRCLHMHSAACDLFNGMSPLILVSQVDIHVSPISFLVYEVTRTCGEHKWRDVRENWDEVREAFLWDHACG